MSEYRAKKRAKKRSRRWNLKKIFLLVFCAYSLFTLIGQQITVSKLNREKKEKEIEINILKKDIGELKSRIQNKTDITYIEKIARDELDMVRPNEIMYEEKASADDEKQ